MMQGYAKLVSGALPKGATASPFERKYPLMRIEFQWLGEFPTQAFTGKYAPTGRQQSSLHTFHDGQEFEAVRTSCEWC